jgi:hypothetical protein
VALKVVNLEDVYVSCKSCPAEVVALLFECCNSLFIYIETKVWSQSDFREDDIEDIQRVRAPCCWMRGSQLQRLRSNEFLSCIYSALKALQLVRRAPDCDRKWPCWQRAAAHTSCATLLLCCRTAPRTWPLPWS